MDSVSRIGIDILSGSIRLKEGHCGLCGGK
jgi:hypothetical protein